MMMSNLTPQEHFRVYGSPPAVEIEKLLDAPDYEDALSGIEAHVSEALGQYPDEDFLQDLIKRVNALAKCVRGDNREEAESIAYALEDLQTKYWQDSEYGTDELKKAEKLIEGLNR